MNRATLLSRKSAASGRQTTGRGVVGAAVIAEGIYPCPDMRLACPAVTERGDDNRLVWIDLEMTGLDVEQHTIVEIACLVTDSKLELVDDGIDLVVHADADALSRMDDFVRRMHTKSGLLPLIQAADVDIEAAEVQVLDYVKRHVATPASAPLCGNSIGVDRRFLDKYMRDLDSYLHYRSVDVSSLKELCRRWYPAIYSKRPNKSEQHRALDDIRESIEELRYYREHLLLPGTTPPGQ
jgi:oligoribonuclease